MPKFSANLTTMFTELPFEQRFEAAAKAGFKAIECLFPYSVSPERLAGILKHNGLKQAMFNLQPGNWEAGDRGLACDPTRFEELKASVALGIAYAQATSAPRVHMMAGIADANDTKARDSYCHAAAYAADAFASVGLDVLLEPINNRSVPGYFLNSFDMAEALIKDINRPNIRLQYDVFHRQIIHGDVLVSFKRLLPLIGHVQIASIPSRHEPDLEELNYPFLFQAFDAAGYDGYIGCEYNPRKGTEAGLAWFDTYRKVQ